MSWYIRQRPETKRMTMDLFTSRSILTMVHGIVLGGGALMALFASLFALQVLPSSGEPVAPPIRSTRLLQWLLLATAVMLWLTVLGGTYVVFPPYRATPPEGIAELSQYPRSLLTSNPQTAWLHSFGMEIKEHVPWIAAILATAFADNATRERAELLANKELKRMVTLMLAITFLLVAFVSVLGVFINKVAPLD
jgi:hypothetical protein